MVQFQGIKVHNYRGRGAGNAVIALGENQIKTSLAG